MEKEQDQTATYSNFGLVTIWIADVIQNPIKIYNQYTN